MSLVFGWFGDVLKGHMNEFVLCVLVNACMHGMTLDEWGSFLLPRKPGTVIEGQ